MPGYHSAPEDLRLQEVYGYWVHANPGTHLDGGVRDDSASATTRRGRRGDVNSRSCHQSAMTLQVVKSGDGLLGRWGRR